jgi:iron-sulfur cluster insertion protein
MIAMETMITITKSAAHKISVLAEATGKTALKLRIYIVGGGCSGFKYGFKFDENVNEDDILIEQHEAALVVDMMSLQYLQSAIIDYVEDLKGAQFVVENPNAETTCGCGASFSLKED